ncbi:hypothetical protein OROGR_003841 [Orobanche gracilis]
MDIKISDSTHGGKMRGGGGFVHVDYRIWVDFHGPPLEVSAEGIRRANVFDFDYAYRRDLRTNNKFGIEKEEGI